MKKRFYLNKQDGMALGVCAGLGKYLGVDPTFVRIGAVVVTLLGAFPWTLIAYGVTAWMAKPAPIGGYAEDSCRIGGSTYDYQVNARDLDQRLAEVDTFVAGRNSSLAREIEELR